MGTGAGESGEAAGIVRLTFPQVRLFSRMQKIPPIKIFGKKCFRCSGCKVYKPKCEYHKNRAKANGIMDKCKTCRAK